MSRTQSRSGAPDREGDLPLRISARERGVEAEEAGEGDRELGLPPAAPRHPGGRKGHSFRCSSRRTLIRNSAMAACRTTAGHNRTPPQRPARCGPTGVTQVPSAWIPVARYHRLRPAHLRRLAAGSAWLTEKALGELVFATAIETALDIHNLGARHFKRLLKVAKTPRRFGCTICATPMERE
jgi:hypothetical protein